MFLWFPGNYCAADLWVHYRCSHLQRVLIWLHHTLGDRVFVNGWASRNFCTCLKWRIGLWIQEKRHRWQSPFVFGLRNRKIVLLITVMKTSPNVYLFHFCISSEISFHLLLLLICRKQLTNRFIILFCYLHIYVIGLSN